MKISQETMDRGIELAGAVILLGVGVSLAACRSTGDGHGHQIASCEGGYPDGGGIKDLSPDSPNAGSFQPDCESKG
ncbi:MAG: hypothetical protein ACREEP_18825 [Dongiaceae bacterium]